MTVGLAQNLSFILLGEDKTASSSMKKVETTADRVTKKIGGAFQRVGGIIGGEFGGVISGVGAGIDGLAGKTQRLGIGLTVGGAAATGAGIALMNFGSANKQATDQLSASLIAAGTSYGDFKEEIEATVAAMQEFGHSDDDTQTALANLTIATDDPKKALEQMGLVADLAAKKHISLADASTLVAKIINGSGGKTLKQYGITMEKTKDGTLLTDKALGQLAAKLRGQAAASVDNFTSKVDVAKTKLGDWAADIANKVGPVLAGLGPVVTVAGVAIEILRLRHEKAAAGALMEAAATLTLKDAAVAATVATEAETVAMAGLDVAMDANPIGLVAGGLVILGSVMAGVALSGTKDLTAETQAYVTALQDANGELDENITKVATKALIDNGSLKNARDLGISTNLVVQASIGNKDAQAALSAQLGSTRTAILNSADANGRLTEKQRLALIKAEQLQVAIGDEGTALKDAKVNVDLMNESLDDSWRVTHKTTAEVEKLSAAFGKLPKHTGLTVDSGGTVRYNDSVNTHYSSRATGGNTSPGEITRVGERGPELVKLPGGSHVYPTGTGPAASGGSVMFAPTLQFNGPVAGDKQALAKLFTDALVSAWKQGMSTSAIKQALGIS